VRDTDAEAIPAAITFAAATPRCIFNHIFVATTVHIPKTLLEAVDRRARALRISRNRLIVRALERELGGEGGWSPGFFEALTAVDPATSDAADEMLAAIRAARSSKKAPRL
jgi:hypothetical protein